ncbi:MAG: histidine kinase, partial [Pseudonocardia sp.]|nr:histidine kinase [Pseudonocardia sp.]
MTTVRKATAKATASQDEGVEPGEALLHALAAAMVELQRGNFGVRLSRQDGLLGDVSEHFNELVVLLERHNRDLLRISRVVGREGRMMERLDEDAVDGAWNEGAHAVNSLIDDLARPTAEIARVLVAVAEGDLSEHMALEIESRPLRGEFLRIGRTVNKMVDQLSSFADEVTRVAREVGTEGRLGGQAAVPNVSGTWRDLTENVNQLADNLTGQVRNIAQVTTAVAKGDLSQKITVDARGEILQLKNTINKMVDQLSAFAREVTRVAREVGTEGRLGGQAEVEGVSGTWKRLTENVNQLAGNLTTQVRAIADVATAVTRGKLDRTITVDAPGEVGELKDNINQMIANLRETTIANQQQDWLKSNLARIGAALQGQRDLAAVSRLIMSELTPLVDAQLGAFFMAEATDGSDPIFRLLAGYGVKPRRATPYRLGEGLVGQAALEKKSIVLSDVPKGYLKITSALGSSSPSHVVVLPVLFEDRVLAVIELASFRPFSEVHQGFLAQIVETVGVVLNTIIATTQTEVLLEQSQSLATELQSRSAELQARQLELQNTNAELEEKAVQLARQNSAIEVKNAEIELARRELEDRAEQLALSSKYKSE